MAYGSFGSGDMYWFTSAAWSTPRISNEPAINNPLGHGLEFRRLISMRYLGWFLTQEHNSFAHLGQRAN
jgi:hypothetical protein